MIFAVLVLSVGQMCGGEVVWVANETDITSIKNRIDVVVGSGTAMFTIKPVRASNDVAISWESSALKFTDNDIAKSGVAIYIPSAVDDIEKIEFYMHGSRKTYYASGSTMPTSGTATSTAIASTSTSYEFWSSPYSKNFYYAVGGHKDGSGNDYIDKIVVTFASSSPSCTPRTFKSGEKIFFQDASGDISGLSAKWKTASNNVYAYFYGSNDGAADTWSTTYGNCVTGTWDVANAIYEFTVPQYNSADHTWTGVIFTRGTEATWGGKTHQTSDQQPCVGENMYIQNTSAAVDSKYNGSWGVYSNGPAIVGEMNNWLPDGGVFDFSGSTGTVVMNLEASTTYEFKVLEGTTWRGNNGTISSSIESGSSWLFETDKNNCKITTGEAGEYVFKWDNSNKKLWVSYPGDRLRKNTYLYFDASYSTNWQSAEFDTKFYFVYYDSNTAVETKFGDDRISDTSYPWVFYTTVPDNDYVGKVQIMRMKDDDHYTEWNYANMTNANTRSSALQNCVYITEAQADLVKEQTLQWKTYCPPMSSATLSDNSTTVIAGTSGNGSTGNPYIVPTSGTIQVQAAATSAVPDPAMTKMFDFKVNNTSQQNSTATTYSKGSLSNNTIYQISVDAYNTYNETNGTKVTPGMLYYKALNQYSVTIEKTGVTKSSGAEGSNAVIHTYADYEAVFAASTGYNLPASVTVTRGGSDITANCAWVQGTGRLTIPAAQITGNITITIAGVAKTTAITLDKNNSDESGSTSGSVTATYGSKDVSSLVHATRTGYTQNGYETSDHTLILKADGTFDGTHSGYTDSKTWVNESANVTLYARWTANKFNVTHTLSNVSRSSGGEAGSNKATYGTAYSVVFAASSGYTLPDAVTVTVGGSDVTANCTWVQGTGTLTIPAAYVTGNIVITVTGEAAVTYTVTYVYNGAEGGSQPASATGSSVSLPYPTKTGCTLQGWYTSSGALAGAATATYNPTSNITLYALWRENCDGVGTKTLVDINFKGASWSGKTFSQANDNNEDCINGVYFWSKNSDKHFSLASNTSNGLTFPNNNMSSGNYYFCIPITGINSSSKQITVTLKHGYSSAKATYKYVYIDGRTSFEDGNTGGSSGTGVTDAANADTEISFTKSSLGNTSGHLIIGRGGSDFTQIYGVTVTTPNNATCYYVTYNGNGADGGFMTDETAHGSGDNVAILANTYTREGYTFTGWKTAPSSGTSYSPEGTITAISSDITLYAQWSKGTRYAVTYNGNGATSGSVPVDASSPYASGANVTVLDNSGSLALDNYTFDGWATANDGTGTSYAADGTISGISADVELFAKWKQTVTLATGSQGSGDNETPTVYLNGATLNGFNAHTATGYTLNGYYTAATGGTKVLNADGTFAGTDVTNYITGSKWSRTDATTLYAQWRAAAGPTCYTWDATETKPQTGTDVNFGGLYLTAPNRTKASFYKDQAADSCYDISAKARTLYGHLNGLEIASVKFAVSSSSSDYRTIFIAFCSSTTFSTSNIIEVGGYQGTVYTVNKNDAAKSEFTVNAPAGTKSFAIGRNMDGITYSQSFTAGQNRYLYYLQVCSAGGGTHTISYANGGGTGTMSSNTSIADDGSQPLTTNGFTAPTNYSFAGWVADGAVTIGGDVKTAGTLIADGATITNITTDIALTAKWSQTITLDANTANNGSGDNTSATAMYNATSLASITHTTPASGYKLTGYYTAATDGTKVLNSDGTFASSNVADYITDGKWICVASARTLYAQYEAAGALIWNLGVNTDATSLTTSSKTSAFTQIAVANMSNATTEVVTYSKSKKTNLTGLISTPATEQSGQYVYVTFVVADGYKFTPSSVKVKAQPKDEAKYVKFELSDASTHSQAYTSASLEAGNIHDVIMTGDGTAYTGTVTLKIYCYGATDSYRLGTPIQIDGEVEETCATMPSFTQMNYSTTTFAPNADASGSPITIIGGENINTYQWKYNTTNDRTSGTDCGNGPSLVPLTDVASGTTRYYWCEMTNTECHITIKSPAVAITVVAAKSDATVSWTGTTASANYGGGGYNVTATVSTAGWDGNAEDLTLSAPAGIRIYGIVSGTADDKKYVQASFDVTTAFDRETYSSTIPFVVTADATTTYNAISDEHAVSYAACASAGEGESYNICMRKVVTKDGNYYHCANTDGWISANISSSYSTEKASATMAMKFDTVAKSNTQYVWVRTYHADINKVRIYADFRADNMTVANVYKSTNYFSADSKYAVDYTAIYNGDEGYDDLGDAAQGYVDIELDNVLEANDVLLVAFNTNKVRPLGAVITEGSAGSLDTYLQWSGSLADGATVNKKTTDAYFTYSASMITENTNSLGAITYSSSVPSVATVDATGKVAMVAAGTTTIKATLAASGCYKKAEISYTLNVTEEECAIAAGTLTLTSGLESKCSDDEVTLTLTGFESGATLQWKDGDTDITNGGNYTIETDGTTSTLTTKQPGTYSVIVTKSCFVRSNRITITNKSTSVHVTRLVKEWYIKNGRLTPDIALWELGDDCSFVSVAASGSWDTNTGLTAASSFYEEGGIVYLKGTEPNPNAGAVQDYTLTLTVKNGCGEPITDEGEEITIHHQQNTDKHVLAFVVGNTEKKNNKYVAIGKGFTESIPASQTTQVSLYNAIAAQFAVQPTNIYSTDDEQKIKEYYSQFDIICITDYPNTQTKGANSNSYVDAIGALIDIRPILTMEAFVSALPNWKLKGVSGNPKSPTTRQYTMLLQCKDHEIFAGTELTQVGTGDEAMFRISMVDNAKEDYATLDATYGATLPHKEKESKSGAGDGEYNYGGKPALQGFTYTQEMSNNDLLPLGLIDDGSGNDLQVGIERQAVMEARLMVLGINSYAMERLDKDGETVVINALNYLLKKNAEDIADCSISFVGGAEGDAKNWHNVANWTGNTLPTKSQKVRILADCELNEPAHVAGVTIVNGGKYNHGNDDAKGKLTIMPNGALVVTGKVQEAKAPAYNKPYATSPEHLIINTSETAQAALIFNNDEASTKATVNYYSLGRKKDDAYQFQYFAIPFEYLSVSPTFANVTHNTTIYTFVWHEASGWERRGYYSDLYAFEGVGITTASTSAINYEMKGTLASTAEREITLTKDNTGENIIGNSWMAPIDIASLKNAIGDDNNVEKVVYIYITGNDNGTGSSSSTETAGKWLAIPIDASGWRDWTGQKVIPAMQAYYIKAKAETTLTLNYDKVVRSTAVEQLNVPLKAPRRTMNNDGISLLTLRLENSKEHTDLYLFEGERFSDGYDNGWEAKQMADEGVMQFYAMNGEDKMAVLATDELEGTPVCFTPGNESNYTISFFGGDGRYYLNDLKEEQSTAIEQGNTYSFTYEQGDMPHRFLISTTPFGIPSVTTGIGGVEAQEKVQKVIYNDHVYIIRGGKIYDVMGKMMK